MGQVFALPFKREYCIAIVQEANEQPQIITSQLRAKQIDNDPSYTTL